MFKKELLDLVENYLLRRLRMVESVKGTRALIGGRELTLFCTNDYLGLSGCQELAEAAKEAIDSFGFGSGSAPLISGWNTYQMRLEEELAAFKGAQAALVFGSGYLANVGLIPALAREGDLVLSDSLNHASIIDGCRLSKAQLKIYEHCDPSSLETQLGSSTGFRRLWIVTEGAFSMDGDIAPLPDILRISRDYGATVILDDAHATGTIGRSGRGTLEYFSLGGESVVQMGTLGKALGSYGAFVAADHDVIDWLINSARSFMFSTALPPAACAAGSAALGLIRNRPTLRSHLSENQALLRQLFTELGLEVMGEGTPIVPVITKTPNEAVRIADGLMDAGFFAPAIRPPTVPEGKSRIRFTVSALHTKDEVDALTSAVKGLIQG